MSTAFLLFLIAAALVVTAVVALTVAIRARQMHLWIGSYAIPAEPRPAWHEDDQVDVFIAICDHWEPRCYRATDEVAMARVRRWRDDYPRLFSEFADVDGRAPRYTFFFPEDEYRPEYMDEIRPLVDAEFADVDVHLHHHNDTAQQLRDKLEAFRETLYYRHGLLRRDPITGEIVYGFIHGNWSLCNSRPDGKLCGVDAELTVLRETGCYADFTLPSAPSATQTQTINSIYYAQDLPGQRKSHNTGIRARVGQAPPMDHLLMIQGPLVPDWARRRWGVIPRIENADLHGGRGPDLRRLKLWMKAGVHVAGRPDWRFVKLHTHGCKDVNIDTMLGPAMQNFHRELRDFNAVHPNFRYHYVSAWEMAQLVHQAEQGLRTPLLGAALQKAIAKPSAIKVD
ncbi:hypothetical protein [Planctomicrobium piriforme]|uniref:Uncharacterized protein n=1 Tax=Planctomicrobium piriforme TaxID=1576369 RepID=A0A1I3CB20_9PLAN|nr:hypothetical protein [Planctomicrobium piriforme]SFH71755.1 hypothetical protein SAMN05421753_102204 [Planctomicrobium piriforme]